MERTTIRLCLADWSNTDQQNNIYKNFKREVANRAKQAAITPLIKLFKHIKNFDILQKLNPSQLSINFLDQLKFCKPVPTVKGKIWHLLGIIMFRFHNHLQMRIKQNIQKFSFADLKQLYNNDKNLTVIVKILKGIKYILYRHSIDKQTLTQLGTIVLSISLHNSPQLALSALSIIIKHTFMFNQCIFYNAKKLIQNLLFNLKTKNKQVKEKASEALQKILQIISMNTGNSKGKEIFSWTIRELWSILENEGKDNIKFQMGKLIGVIRMIGTSAKTIKEIEGPVQLKLLFQKLIQLKNKKVLNLIQKQQQQSFSFISDRTSFKVILYKQKQLTAFINAFALIVKQLQQLKQVQVYQLLQMAVLGIRQHSFFYEKYKQQLYDSLVLLIIGLYQHRCYFVLWLKKFITLGLKASMELPTNKQLLTQEYYNILIKASTLWQSILKRSIWTSSTIEQYSDIFLITVQNLLNELDVSYSLIQNSNEDLMNDENEEMLSKKENNIRYVANNQQQYQYLCQLVVVIQPLLDNNWISRLYPLIKNKLRKYPDCIPFIKLFTGVNLKAQENNFFLRLKSNQRKDYTQVVRQQINHVILRNHKSQGVLLYEGLKCVVSVPFALLQGLGQEHFLNNILGSVKLALSISLCTLNISALGFLRKLVNKFSKISYKILSQIIPLLSNYILSTQKQSSKLQKQENWSLSLHQLNIDRNKLVQQVKLFLGQIGGLAHLIVPNFNNQKLNFLNKTQIIAWDYDVEIKFDIPFLSKKLTINLVKYLPRILQLSNFQLQ